MGTLACAALVLVGRLHSQQWLCHKRKTRPQDAGASP